MARLDIIRAEMEFFGGGGENGAMPTIPAGTLFYDVPASVTATYGYERIYLGMPLAATLQTGPHLFLFMPQSRERRPLAQKKFIDYTCELRLAWVAQGKPSSGAVGSDAMRTFYGWIDQIAVMIRTGGSAKQLITPSYQTGGDVVVWGETFSVEETHSPLETSTMLLARFLIDCTEQVNA